MILFRSAYSVSLMAWLILAALVAPLLSLEKGTTVIWLNEHRTAFWDFFFIYVTYLGTGYVYVPFALYYLWKRRCVGYGFLIVMGLLIAIVTIIKQFAPDALRPVAYFEGVHQFRLISGVAPLSHHSFPSGHTATAFGLVIYLLITQKKYVWIPIGFLICLLVGISRMYLLQHFLEDVYAGMVIGGLCAFAGYALISKRKSETQHGG